MKIFGDDLEDVLNAKPYHQDGQPYLDILHPQSPDSLNSIVQRYLEKNFEISVNGKKADPAYLGYEMEDLAMWCYLEVRDVRELKSIKVKNSILIDTFSDQVYIVHVNYEDNIKSMKLGGNDLTGEIDFE